MHPMKGDSTRDIYNSIHLGCLISVINQDVNNSLSMPCNDTDMKVNAYLTSILNFPGKNNTEKLDKAKTSKGITCKHVAVI